MKTTLFYLIFIGFAFLTACTPSAKNPGNGIHYFKGDFNLAINEATNKNKPIFIYCYTTWCGYCKKMEKSTLIEKEVSDYMNKTYVNLSYNMDETEGIYIQNKFNVVSYPTCLILNSQGEVQKIEVGYIGLKNFMQFVKK